jgi:hypothetical protein
MSRGLLSSTFPREEGELKDYMRENEGMNGGMAPEEEASQKGQGMPLVERALFNPGCPDYLRSGNFSSGHGFLLVHRRISSPHKLVHSLARGIRSQPDGGIDA